MKYAEREEIVESLPYESRVGFIAFCVDRCLNEAQRHPVASEQIDRLPLLREGLEMLLARAEMGIAADPERIEVVLGHLQTYEVPTPDGENVVYNWDITLVNAARMLVKGMRVLKDPQRATPEYVSGALEGIAQSVGAIYADGRIARKAEVAIADTALERLRDWRNESFSRKVFDKIPEWGRGKLSKQYAAGHVKGSAEDEE